MKEYSGKQCTLCTYSGEKLKKMINLRVYMVAYNTNEFAIRPTYVVISFQWVEVEEVMRHFPTIVVVETVYDQLIGTKIWHISVRFAAIFFRCFSDYVRHPRALP